MEQQHKSNDPFQEARSTISVAIGLSQAFCMPVRVWFTRFGTAGELFFGGRISVIGWMMLPLWGCMFTQQNCLPLFGFWAATTLLLVCHRFRHWMLKLKGYHPHSRYAGTSRLTWLCGQMTARRVAEPLLTAILGGFCMQWNEPLGMYLVWASFALVLSTGYAFAMDESMMRRINDARWEQEWLEEKMRDRI